LHFIATKREILVPRLLYFAVILKIADKALKLLK